MTDFIVDPLVEFCVDVIGEIGYLGIFLLMLVESANIPMPSEATMLFAGFKVDDGDLTLLGITAAGVLGNVVGSWAGYAIGYWGREELLERHHVFHVSPKAMARVEDWFDRYGPVTVFFTRMLPIVRTFISTPAGAAHMNFAKFTLYTAAGCIPWVLMLGFIGVQVGSNWEEQWDTPASQNTWTRFAFDITYSPNPSVGNFKVYVDLNGDSDFSDANEQSPRIFKDTLRVEEGQGNPEGSAPGQSIPSTLRAGIYQNQNYSCPSGCSVDIDNVQVVKP